MILQSHFPPDIRVEKEMKALSSAGFSIILLSNKSRPAPVKERMKYGTVFRLGDFRFLGPALNRKKNFPVPVNPVWVFSFLKVLFYEDVQAIHVHDLPFALFGIVGKLLFHKKFILDLHENYPAALALWGKKGNRISRLFRNSHLAEIYEILSLHFADKVIVVAPAHRTYLKKKYRISSDIRVVGNTVEWGKYEKFDLDPAILQKYEDFFVLSFLGQFSPERDLDVAVEAIQFLKPGIPNLKMLFVGDGVYRKTLQEKIKKENVEEIAEIVGWIPFEKTASYLAASDVCIIPQGSNDLIDNGTPHKLFQYMAMGKPVVVSDAKALKQVVEETQCGEVFRSRSPEDFAHAVLKIKNNPDFPYGKNGIKAVQEKYNWGNSAKALRELYEEVFQK